MTFRNGSTNDDKQQLRDHRCRWQRRQAQVHQDAVQDREEGRKGRCPSCRTRRKQRVVSDGRSLSVCLCRREVVVVTSTSVFLSFRILSSFFVCTRSLISPKTTQHDMTQSDPIVTLFANDTALASPVPSPTRMESPGTPRRAPSRPTTGDPS